jgi:hypothetical protein
MKISSANHNVARTLFVIVNLAKGGSLMPPFAA